jgi:hypothetical protein
MTVFFTLVLSLFNTVFRGYLIKTFWAWFIMTIFTTLPSIGLLAGIGLSLFLSSITAWRSMTIGEWEDVKGISAEDSSNLQLINGVFLAFALAVTLGVGWVVHHYM